ncbi:MAG: 2-C-methyl-D-erythritol 4-phosphate cytidylyltransferase [Deltaproteobacteria bacterium]|nr:2-C-methyl-D-erythritol 4-phosphate cytidylyltransferase [Deltaproteobacteria bacterium]
MIRTTAIVPSAGLGKRMGGVKKNFLKLGTTPVLAITLKALDSSPLIDSIIVAVSKDDIEFCKKDIVESFNIKKVAKVIAGGAEREESVRLALSEVPDDIDIVLVHDGARPFIDETMIKYTIDSALRFGAAITGVMPKDTIKTTEDGFVEKTLHRASLIAVQTPQAFKADLIRNAYKLSSNATSTDCASLVERTGAKVKVVPGNYRNIKITTEEDLVLANAFFENP